MARQTIELLIDDLDGSRLGEGEGGTVTFALQGSEYSIDLSSQHIDELNEALAKYVAAAQKISGRRTSASTAASRSNNGSAKSDSANSEKVDLAAVRAWARENGHEVSDRGRVSQKVLDAYNSQK